MALFGTTTYTKVKLFTLSSLITVFLVLNLGLTSNKPRLVRSNVLNDSDQSSTELNLSFRLIENGSNDIIDEELIIGDLDSFFDTGNISVSDLEVNITDQQLTESDKMEDPLKIALINLHSTFPASDASMMSQIGVFSEKFGRTNIWQHHIKILIPYNFETFLLPLTHIEEMLNDTIQRVTQLAETWEVDESDKTRFGTFSSHKQSQVCRGIKFLNDPRPGNKFVKVCKSWSLNQFSIYLIRELGSLHRATMGHVDTLKNKVLKRRDAFQGLESHEDEDESSQKQSQNKRAIVEIGIAEKYLFGTATIGDIDRVTDTFGAMIQVQGDIIVAADHSLAILKSHTKNIQTVAQAVKQLQGLVENVANNIKDDIGDKSLITQMLSNNLYTQSGHVIYTRAGLILQDLETNFQATTNGLNQAVLGKFTMNVVDPQTLAKMLKYWEEDVFDSGKQFLWGNKNTKDLLQYYTHSRIRLLNSKKNQSPVIELSIPTTRREELLQHYRIITTPYKSYYNTSTYRISTGFSRNKVDILQRGEDIFYANADNFVYHPESGIDQYTTSALTKIKNSEYYCFKSIITENITDILNNCKLISSDSQTEIHQVTKERYLIYSEKTIPTLIDCQQPKKDETHFNKTVETRYLYELIIPDICNVETEDTLYLGEPITLITRTMNKTKEFKLIVQNSDEFKPEIWYGILDNINRFEEKTLKNLIQDIRSFKFSLIGDGNNETERLLIKLSDKLTRAKLGNWFARKLLELVKNPWVLSYTSMALLLLIMAMVLSWLINKMSRGNKHSSYHRPTEAYEMLDNPDLDTSSLVSLMRSRLENELPTAPES